ncbi:MAG: NAD-dependent succinate-semialdehyde dehydrogenase [Vicinamibacterales bacterium]|nr:NAD-dependent succinate-semialdehyde dehydrogenase [Vicinamibacterales bacterium]
MTTYPLYLNGHFVTSGTALEVINPATAEPFARMATTDRARLATALDDAHRAFLQWRRLTGKARGAFLHAIADQVESRRADIATTITLENGKPLAQSQGEVTMTVDHLRWFAEEARRTYGRVVPNQVEGKRHLVIKSPMGVVGAISPWNFPLVLAARKVAPALAAGCTVILKPASQTPICAALFAECVHAAGLPPGVFQTVVGPSSAFGDELLSNPLCRKITFTGSTEVGRVLIRGAAASIKPLSLELGGHAPVLIFADADLDQAVEGALAAKFRNTGQSCIAANRVLVERGIYEAFLEAFVAKARALKVGDGLEPGVDIGPLFDEAGVAKAIEHVDDAVAGGARLLCGGRRVAGRPGYFVEPTVLADVPVQSACMRDETFAPIAPVCAFDREEEAIELANASIYGLSAYAFTSNLDRAFRLMEGLESGTIGLNDGVPSTSQCPFGGVKQSGWGRELGSEGLDAFLETKHVSMGLRI